MARREEAPETRPWHAPDEPEQQPSLLDRARLYYERHPRTVHTASIGVLLAALLVGVAVYRERTRRSHSLAETHAAASILELESLLQRYPDTEAAPIIQFKLARAHLELAQAPGPSSADERLALLRKAREQLERFGRDHQGHALINAVDETLQAILTEERLLKQGHQEHDLRHTLVVHPELIERRARGEGSAADPDLDLEVRLSPSAGRDPRARIEVETVRFEVVLFPEEAPEGAAAFLNDVRIQSFRGNGCVPELDHKRYRLSSGPARPATFVPVRNGREPDVGMIALELDASGKPTLGQYVLFNEPKEALKADRDRYHVIGRVTTPMAHLKTLGAESKVTREEELTGPERHEAGLPDFHP